MPQLKNPRRGGGRGGVTYLVFWWRGTTPAFKSRPCFSSAKVIFYTLFHTKLQKSILYSRPDGIRILYFHDLTPSPIKRLPLLTRGTAFARGPAFIGTHTRKCYVSFFLTFKVMKKLVTVIVYVLVYVPFHLLTCMDVLCNML